ncbi:MAG: glycerophosphodiester phosphodiesterase [Acidimicrobiia bacterium]
MGPATRNRFCRRIFRHVLQKRDNLLIIGHRGWRARFPDNSLEGIMAAAEVAAMVEVDIRRAATGTLVLSHDPVTPDRDPPTLDEVLAAVPSFPLNLEIKNFPGDDGFEDDHGLALETAARSRPGDLLTCFFWPTVDEVRLRYPEVATGLLIDVGASIADATAHAFHQGHSTLVPNWELVFAQPDATRKAVAAGLAVAVWTINDPATARAFAKLGVGAIITDDPGLMAAALTDRIDT